MYSDILNFSTFWHITTTNRNVFPKVVAEEAESKAYFWNGEENMHFHFFTKWKKLNSKML